VPSDASDVALALARALLADKSAERAGRALALLDAALAKAALAEGERGSLMQSKAAALSALGRVEEALALMDAMPEIDPAASAALLGNRIRLELTRGEIARTELAKLEEEWPKWQLMPEERERHRRLFDQAISSFLYPAALHPDHRALTAAGLYQAAALFAEQGRPEEARIRLEEIVQFYPEPEFVGKASELQEKLKEPNEPEN
jgi:tetratricopeptide (TPR) repeat protein